MLRWKPIATKVRFSTKRTPLQEAFKFNDDEEEMERYRMQKNPKIPNLQGLSERWPKMDALQQDDVIAYLEDKQRGDWRLITPQEKSALRYIYFGHWGARGDVRDPAVYKAYAIFIGALTVGVLGVKFV